MIRKIILLSLALGCASSFSMGSPSNGSRLTLGYNIPIVSCPLLTAHCFHDGDYLGPITYHSFTVRKTMGTLCIAHPSIKEAYNQCKNAFPNTNSMTYMNKAQFVDSYTAYWVTFTESYQGPSK